MRDRRMDLLLFAFVSLALLALVGWMLSRQ